MLCKVCEKTVNHEQKVFYKSTCVKNEAYTVSALASKKITNLYSIRHVYQTIFVRFVQTLIDASGVFRPRQNRHLPGAEI